MALKKNKECKNPNRRPMSVADMSFPVSKDNQKVLSILDEMDKKSKGNRV